MSSADYQYDAARNCLVHGPSGRTHQLTSRQLQIYKALDDNRGRPMLDSELLEDIYGIDTSISPEIIRVTVMLMRRRVADQAVVETEPVYRPLRGGPDRCGYVLRPPSMETPA